MKQKTSTAIPRYDVVVVGAGMGGLGSAVTLSRLGYKVCVVEQHYVPGGYYHSFKRRGFVFDAAVEYIGSCGEGGAAHRLFKALGVASRLQFCEMDPDGFDVLLFPSLKVSVKKNIQEYQVSLLHEFPAERVAIEKYFELVNTIWTELHSARTSSYLWEERMYPPECPMTRQWADKTLQELFDSIAAPQKLQAVLAGQWGDYGLPPKQVSTLVHIATIQHYHGGAYYPHGGVQTIPNALVEVLRGQSGEIQYRSRVAGIEVRPRSWKRVQFSNGQAVECQAVIINADVKHALELIRNLEDVDQEVVQQIHRNRPSVSSFQVYLGVTLDLGRAGMTSANYWSSPTEDINACYEELFGEELPSRLPYLLTSTTLKDPYGFLSPPGTHIVKLVALMPFSHFQRWANTPLGRRGRDYRGFKSQIADMLIRQAEELLPGLSRSIVLKEIGTPLTNVSYTLTSEGAIYGSARTPEQFGSGGIRPALAASGIYLVGASTFYHGVVGSLLSGYQVGLKVAKECLN